MARGYGTRPPPKYNEWGEPTDPEAPAQWWLISRPHGNGSFRYESRDLAEQHAARICAEQGEPVTIWQAVTQYRPLPPARPTERIEINADDAEAM